MSDQNDFDTNLDSEIEAAVLKYGIIVGGTYYFTKNGYPVQWYRGSFRYYDGKLVE